MPWVLWLAFFLLASEVQSQSYNNGTVHDKYYFCTFAGFLKIVCNVFQDPFQKIKYTLIGDDMAPHYFKINENDGKITIQSDIKNDIVTDYQVQYVEHQNNDYILN